MKQASFLLSGPECQHLCHSAALMKSLDDVLWIEVAKMLCGNLQIKCSSSSPGGKTAGQAAWQPAQMPRGHLLGTKWHLCSVSKRLGCKRPCFAASAPEETLFSLRRGCYSTSHAVCSCCLPAFSPKWPGWVEVSFHQEETLQKALMSCLAQGGKAWFLDFSCFSLLTVSGQGTG